MTELILKKLILLKTKTLYITIGRLNRKNVCHININKKKLM